MLFLYSFPKMVNFPGIYILFSTLSLIFKAEDKDHSTMEAYLMLSEEMNNGGLPGNWTQAVTNL